MDDKIDSCRTTTVVEQNPGTGTTGVATKEAVTVAPTMPEPIAFVPGMSETTASSSLSSASNTDEPANIANLKQNSLQQTRILTQLAAQLEYYFSQQNLAQDTYVNTLRKLNDGCVPVSILANFPKVRVIVGSNDDEVRIHAILQAMEYTDVLHVQSIDTATGKIATDETPSSATTILAVGPIHNEPLTPDVMKKISSVHSLTSLQPCNVVILRDVGPEVTEEEVRQLFEFEGCPDIQSIYCDVAFSWFITLNSDLRETMMRVMMHVRTQTLRDNYVQARLKATATASFDDAPPMPIRPDFTVADMMPQKKKKKKRNKRNKKRSTGKEQAAKKGAESALAGAPSMGEDDFPTLHLKKVEWETMLDDEDKFKVDDDYEEEEDARKSSVKSVLSDAASTATTTSSSLDSSVAKKVLGGYAAALLKSAPSTPSPTSVLKHLTSVASEDFGKMSSSMSDARLEQGESDQPAVVITPPAWGRGSFADILKEASRA